MDTTAAQTTHTADRLIRTDYINDCVVAKHTPRA
jgi:hypothetical protein